MRVAGTGTDGAIDRNRHHDRSPELVLVRLERISDEVLVELRHESYTLAGGRLDG